jgi:DNA-binding CsgD family transcriptional regulator
VAVAGSNAELRHVAALAGLDLADAEDAADALVAHPVLAPGRPLRFVHSLVRCSIYSAVLPAERSRLHAALARMLREEEEPPERVAGHLLAAAPRGEVWAVDVLREAARRALRRGAPDAALAYLRRALREPPRLEDRSALLCDLGSAEALLGAPEAIGHLQAALAGGSELSTRSVAALMLGHALVRAGRVPEAVNVLDEAIARLPAEEVDRRLVFEAEIVDAALLDPSTRERAVETLTRFAGRLHGASRAEQLLLATLAYVAAIEGQHASAAVDLAERALDRGQLIVEGNADLNAFHLAVLVLALADRVEPAHRFLDEAFTDTRNRGSLVGFGLTSMNRAVLHYREGALADAEADATNAVSASLRTDEQVMLANSLAVLVLTLVEKGELGTAAALVERHGLGGRLPEFPPCRMFLYARGVLRLARAQFAAALDDFLELQRREDTGTLLGPGVAPHLAGAATALLMMDDRDRARHYAQRDVASARAWGASSWLGAALCTAGLVEGGEAGLALLGEAVTILEGSPARLTYARALVELGAGLRRSGQRSAARAPLRKGLDLAYRCGATALTQRADTELRAAGGRPRQPVIGGLQALTACERRVSELAADGLSNREIAQALFVTTRTVEGHLTHAYQKLGVTSRSDLRPALQRCFSI